MSIQQILSDACVNVLRQNGDNFRGAGYTKSPANAQRCYEVMLAHVRPTSGPVTLVDLGCGLGHFHEYLISQQRDDVRYIGIDLSEDYLTLCRAKYPSADFRRADVLANPDSLPMCDYVVMNGLFNYRGGTPRDEMLAYFQALVSTAWTRARQGIAFNVMSTLVDWEREDLFHVSPQELSTFVWRNLSRHFSIRQDYGMFEHTVYVYREPLSLDIKAPVSKTPGD
ncbi:MAG: class I SAM-dependent methyltransferase [Ramlibacter sp.]